MHPALAELQTYPFQKLQQLLSGLSAPKNKPIISLGLGEPQHEAPAFVVDALHKELDGLSQYPKTKGLLALRVSIVQWLRQRFSVPEAMLDPERHVLPVNGTREALFAFAQTMIEPSAGALVGMPNPFYQIYEGAALLAGARPYYFNCLESHGYQPDFTAVPASVWKKMRLLYVCTPGNPTGAVFSAQTFEQLIEIAQKYDIVLASDECYSEIYLQEDRAPVGLLQVCVQMGLDSFHNCMVFHSLSKRSNLPGLRSGFVAGDAELIEKFLLYRTYQGGAMPPPTQLASIKAWKDEQHVRENRALYRQKFAQAQFLLDEGRLEFPAPEASFYLWIKTGSLTDLEFATRLYQSQGIIVLPGQYLGRMCEGMNPGCGHVRMALVASPEVCTEALGRLADFRACYSGFQKG